MHVHGYGQSKLIGLEYTARGIFDLNKSEGCQNSIERQSSTDNQYHNLLTMNMEIEREIINQLVTIITRFTNE